MTSVHDVAAYILEQHGPMPAMRLHKMLYYAQAWSLVWDERPLFPERIEAWANGPVVPDVFYIHQGRYELAEWEGDSSQLDARANKTVDAVLKFYGGYNQQRLCDLAHYEAPWRDARMGLHPGERSDREIALAAMAEYYEAISAPASV